MNLTVCFAAALSTGLKLTHFQPRAVVVALHVKQYTMCTNMSKWRARAGEGGGPSHRALSVYIYICLHIWACAEKKSEQGRGGSHGEQGVKSLLGAGRLPLVSAPTVPAAPPDTVLILKYNHLRKHVGWLISN